MPSDRTEVLQIRLTPAEKARVKEAAAEMPLSKYVRAVLLTEAAADTPRPSGRAKPSKPRQITELKPPPPSPGVASLMTMSQVKAKRAAERNRPSAA